MIVDTSAVIAVMQREPDADRLIERMAQAQVLGMGAPSLVETGMVLSARIGPTALGLLARFVQEFDIEPVPFGALHWRVAILAYESFGKGNHPARLNFGDCMSYAVAHVADQPLLFVGEDFARTDITPA